MMEEHHAELFKMYKAVTLILQAIFLSPRKAHTFSTKLAHMRGLIPATSLCNKSGGQVTSCELPIFA